MGPNHEGINDVYAGNVFSIGGLDELVFKSASLSSFECCPSLTPVNVIIIYNNKLIFLLEYKIFYSVISWVPKEF